MAKQKKDSASEKEEQKLSEEQTEESTAENKEAGKEEQKDSQKTEKNTAESESEKLQKELAAAKEAHIRTLAEYDNYRKRSTKEKQAAYGDAKADCIKELLPMMDNFERAIATEATDVEGFKKGVEMIFKNFTDVLSKLGVEAFGEKGEKFDPNIHNGVMHVEDEELPENSVAEVFSKGYKLGDRILRPAMVKVAN
ncbi:MAG: nucleotide exchange factor GrpE [Oscillospiraceae bacterium]|nr:nucleotide exchange factor GrpE [Oscillospiraceae bacterium]